MFTDFIINGRASGPFAGALARFKYDDGYFRPFFNKKGEPCVTVNNQSGEKETHRIADLERMGVRNPVFNATSLRFADWIHMEKRLLLATRQPLRAWADLSAASSIGGFDPMAKMTYEYEAMSDPGEVITSMDGRASGRNLAPEFVTDSVPLPIDFVDFTIGQRNDLISRNSGTPISTAALEAGGRRIAEKVEDRVIGLVTGPIYGTRTGFHAHRQASAIYGYANFPQRQIKTDLNTPNGNNPDDTLDDTLEMRELLYNAGFSGPFMLYHSTDWNQYMDADYGKIGTGSSYGFAPSKTLRARLREVEDIQDVRQLRRLTSSGGNPFTMLMVNMDSQTADAINAVTPRTIQWQKDPWELNFRVYSVGQVPVLKYDYNGNCGIVHGTTG